MVCAATCHTAQDDRTVENACRRCGLVMESRRTEGLIHHRRPEPRTLVRRPQARPGRFLFPWSWRPFSSTASGSVAHHVQLPCCTQTIGREMLPSTWCEIRDGSAVDVDTTRRSWRVET